MNRILITGAAGTIGAAFVAKSDPDGDTLLVTPGGHALFGAVFKSLPFDTVASFTWISNVINVPFFALENEPRMSDGAFENFIAENRERLSPAQSEESSSPPPDPAPCRPSAGSSRRGPTASTRRPAFTGDRRT